jgi:hypothetical protein
MPIFEKDGFAIDLNRMTRQEYNDWRKGRKDLDDAQRDSYDAERMLAHVVVKWPFDKPLTLKGYMALGFADSLMVDRMVGEAIEQLQGKESAG